MILCYENKTWRWFQLYGSSFCICLRRFLYTRSQVQRIILCENKSKNINCSKGTILIASAEYGRTVNSVCGRNQNNIECKTKSSTLNKVREACSNKQSCRLSAENAEFGDPCRGTKKYLNVTYTCEDVTQRNGCSDVSATRYNVALNYSSPNSNTECVCSVRAQRMGSYVMLYLFDVRLEGQHTGNCSGTTLTWGDGQRQCEQSCGYHGDYSNHKALNTWNASALWISLRIKQEKPKMVWMLAKATNGKVIVKCGENAVNIPTVSTTHSGSSVEPFTKGTTANESKEVTHGRGTTETVYTESLPTSTEDWRDGKANSSGEAKSQSSK
ncbi:hypothetical protein ScPMuIL_012278 [Solemya velum]